MSTDLPVPETRVLAIASHVVYGYVGNTMAVFVMQSMGCEVAALNTVHFSNHTGYRQVKGTKASAQQILDLYAGLQQSYLTDFDMMLSGYAPSAEAVEAVGFIARDLKQKARAKPGSFFWALDPVMGDQGRLYVHEDVVPAYKKLVHDADLILPNQFELECETICLLASYVMADFANGKPSRLLSDLKVTSLQTLVEAIETIHKTYSTPHIIVTSIRLDSAPGTISVIGSTARSDSSSRAFNIEVPNIDCFFSGTGDMFAALTISRLREIVGVETKLARTKSWVSPDDVEAKDLPLAKATEKVLASMQEVLTHTKLARDKEIEEIEASSDALEEKDNEKRSYLRTTKAAEVRMVRNANALKSPSRSFKAQKLEVR